MEEYTTEKSSKRLQPKYDNFHHAGRGKENGNSSDCKGDIAVNSVNNGKSQDAENLKSGLYLVATPIGNLRDITLRALDILHSCDVILCEDTRTSKKLLQSYSINKKIVSYHDHSDESRRQKIIKELKQGKSLALISDAGMPLISDPGYKLVRECIKEGIYITSIPGANSPLMALQLSGLPNDKFCFLGFLPTKNSQIEKLLLEWKDKQVPLILFESPRRLQKSLSIISEIYGECEIAIAREMTKLFEEVRRSTPQELLKYYQENGSPKGEIVLVIKPPEPKIYSDDDLLPMIKEALKTMKTGDAATMIAKKTGAQRKKIYDLAVKVSKGSN